MVVFSKPVNMDDKANKITYQKSRIICILFAIFVNSVGEFMRYLMVGPSDFEITVKRQKSITTFIMLVAIIVFRQKYEMQILSKYKLENLNFGKVFHLPAFLICHSLATFAFSKTDFGMFLVHSIFLFAYFNFFWEKAKRTLGINRILSAND